MGRPAAKAKGHWSHRFIQSGSLLLVGCLMVASAGAADTYDSGWAVSAPAEPGNDSVLGPSGIRVDRVLPKAALEKLQLPAAEETPSALRWRTAQRPNATRTPKLYPPLSDKPQAPQPYRPAPFVVGEVQPLQTPLEQPLNEPRTLQAPSHAMESARPVITPIPILEKMDPSPVAEAPRAPGAPSPVDPSPIELHELAPMDQPQAIEPAEPQDQPKRESESLNQPDFDTVPQEPSRANQPPAKQQPTAESVKQPVKELVKAPVSQPETTQPEPVVETPAENDQESQPEPRVEQEEAPQHEPTPEVKPAPVAKPRPQLSKDWQVPKEIAKPERNLPPLTKNQQNLRRRLRSVLSFYYRRPLNSQDHDAWEVMHSMLSYGLYSRVQDGGRTGRPVTAVGYLCFNKPCDRRKMFYITADGDLDVRVGVGLQGHKGQLLAMLAQCNVSPDYPIKVDGQDFTVRDLILTEQRTCYARTELSFKLIGLMHYLPSDTTWVNDQGEAWDFPRLIQDERTQKIRGAACGGTHRLAGLTLAYKKREARGEPVEGEWAEAKKFIDEYRNYAFRLQNSDGSLSTEWFRGPGMEESIDRRVRTTGHLLEWLLYTCDDSDLTNPRIVRAVQYLTNLLASNTDNGWEIGPMAHALHALLVYDQRMFGPYDRTSPQVVVRNGKRIKVSPTSLSYRMLNSQVRESYALVQERHEEQLERENSGLGALFGFGRSSQSRRRSR